MYRTVKAFISLTFSSHPPPFLIVFLNVKSETNAARKRTTENPGAGSEREQKTLLSSFLIENFNFRCWLELYQG
jgi:hypothetical protein